MTTKEALDRAMNHAAAVTNRCRALLAVSKAIPADEFERLARQHPCTLERDVENAHREFEQAKAEYEAHCAEIGVAAYATYNED